MLATTNRSRCVSIRNWPCKN